MNLAADLAPSRMLNPVFTPPPSLIPGLVCRSFKVTIPIEDVCRCHLRVMFRHRSSQDCECRAYAAHVVTLL